jgi:hypothetical protein
MVPVFDFENVDDQNVVMDYTRSNPNDITCSTKIKSWK